MSRNGSTTARSRAGLGRLKIHVDDQPSTVASVSSRRIAVDSSEPVIPVGKVAKQSTTIARGALNDVSHANNRLRGPPVPGKENKIVNNLSAAVATTNIPGTTSSSNVPTAAPATANSRPRSGTVIPAAQTVLHRANARPHSTSSAVAVTKIPSSRNPNRESAPVASSRTTLARTASGRLRDEADDADTVARKRPRIFPATSRSIAVPSSVSSSTSASSVATVHASDDDRLMETSEADVEELAKVPEEDEEDATAVPPSVASTHDTKMPAVSESLRSPSPEAEEYIPQWWTDASPASEARYASEIAAIRASFKDEVDEWDPSMVSEYSDEIFEYMGGLEMKSMPDPNYMETQNEIQWHQRTTLVDWLVQIHARYHLTPETLWIAVNIIDRFLSKRVVSLVKLQLVGVTAMFIAAKYEEIVAPSVDEFVFMTENGYTKEEVLKGEKIILQSLGFHISAYCSPYSWVRRISKADDYDIQTRTLSKFLMEVCLLDHRFLCAKPSMLAAIAMYTSRRMLEGDWNDAFVYYSNFTEEQLEPGFEYLVETIAAQGFTATHTYRKYCSKRFLKSSLFARTWTQSRWINGIDRAEDNQAMEQ